MPLITYKKKRNFKETPEPSGGKADSTKLRFVIQKHDASHLHYDFRIEMQGVLKSWAVPKGPSTDPGIKRLAMMVEDHPYDYRNFEGIIPSGYGAGTVIVWDEGFYEPSENLSKDKKEQEKDLRRQLQAGKLKITLKGKKLKGEYAIVKSNGRGENAWLLFKIKDKYANTSDITLKDKSVKSKKTLEQVEKTAGNLARDKSVNDSMAKTKMGTQVNDEKKVKKASLKTKPGNKKSSANNKIAKPASGKRKDNFPDVKGILKHAPNGKFINAVKPMLATLVDQPFNDEGWLYEVKWDGYRAVALMNKGKTMLRSRNNKSFNEKFYPIVEALNAWNVNAVVDGEIVVLAENGISNFGDLQNWRSEADGELYYYLFDIMWLEGKNVMNLPLSERRSILESVVPQEGLIRLSKAFNESGIEFFQAATKMGLEGIIAKRSDSIYSSGNRSKEWLKIKANKRQEMVIGGFTRNDESAKPFSSLLLGVYEKGKLRYTGKVGTGFNDKLQREMLATFKKYIIKTPPFEEIPDINKPSRFQPNPPHAVATWLKPLLVCEVSFTEMTKDGLMRHPSFDGMRIDKKATSVVEEKVSKVGKVVEAANRGHAIGIIPSHDPKQRKSLLNPTDETQVKKINGHPLKFTNLSKYYWPEEKITKRDLLNYYYQVAPYILPYLKNRPQSMLRHPDGITGEAFFFKDVTGKAPSWIETYKYHSGADDRDRNYLVAKDDASILYMVSLGCIELNPWHSRVQKEDFPDWCIIDLDPGNSTFEQVIKAAQVTKEILDEIKVTGYAKTSGSKGIHIYIPLAAKYSYGQSKEFARVIATIVNERLPQFTTMERTVKDRKGKLYIDFLQNRPQATVSAPYSVRPKPGAPVSMPLHWEEVKSGLKIADFTIHNAIARIKSEGDIFKPVLGKGINLKQAIKTFEANLK